MISLDQRDARGGQNVVGGSDASNLALRVASAAVLAPVALAMRLCRRLAVCRRCARSPPAIILWEWTRLVAGAADLRILVPGLAALLAAAVLVGEPAPVRRSRS